ncbi:MAG: DciA family protein [Corynebacterium kroppenstedtii]|nr:DciA family protein [Corynebacterium kroppenstedtii]
MTANWSTVAGDYLAAHSSIRMIKDTTLFLECDSTAKASELRYLQTELLSRIAQHVGPDVITAVKIFGPRPPSWWHGPLHVKGRGPRDTYG